MLVQALRPALRALGIRGLDAYQTRHTYATTALMAGVNRVYIARPLGHKNPTMLFKHDGKWIDGANGGAEAAKLNALYKRKKPAAAEGWMQRRPVDASDTMTSP